MFFFVSVDFRGLAGKFFPLCFFRFPHRKNTKKARFLSFLPDSPHFPPKKRFSLYIYFFSRIYIVIYWGNRGNREKNQHFRGFAAFLLLGENWHKGRKGRFSAAFPVFPDSFALRCVRCLRIIGNFPRVYFCQALRRAIGGGLFLTACVFCQAFRQTMNTRRGGDDHFGFFGQVPYLHANFNLTNMTKSETTKNLLTFV